MNTLTGPGRYVVEKILNHLVDDEDGAIKYEVKWAGYEKKADRTWEPEENLYVSSKPSHYHTNNPTEKPPQKS